ncbi:ankyrin repeat protein [Colletotrichum kahawae]|uniref:Ankyrin repeat protein n=1 Tax=Colletotrichum kahawae TaxID=34407 RepID=A0AAE0CZG1_COLKA|nr:ankyrin repeat protein [Colletotrichum kahawae]
MSNVPGASCASCGAAKPAAPPIFPNDPLHQAAFGDDNESLQRLISAGADVSAVVTARGWTALHLAAQSGSEATVTALLQAGANPSAATGDGVTPLHNAAAGGRVAATKLLLDAGADVGARNIDDETPLHVVAFFGNTQIAKLLVDSGADVSAKDCYGNTPLHIAASHELLDMIQVLLDAGADMNAVNNNGNPVLHHALCDSPVATKFLIQAGANTSLRGQFGTTLLHLPKSSEGLFDLLLGCGGDLEAVNDDGATPLHETAAYGTAQHLQRLITSGANVNATTRKGETALHLTAGDPDAPYLGEDGESEAKARLLVSAGVDVNARTTSGETALDRALNCNRDTVAGFVREAMSHEREGK